MFKKTLWLSLVVMLALPVWPLTAQETDVQTVFTPSGRLSLDIPANWVWTPAPDEEELQGLDSETLVMATAFDHISAYQNFEDFEGTVFYLSAYPYNAYQPTLLGDLPAMLADVTGFDERDVMPRLIADYPAAAFTFEGDGYTIQQHLIDTGEMTYITYVLSTNDDLSALETALDTLTVHPADLTPESETRRVTTEDNRLSWHIPESWLFWNESANTLTFALEGRSYAGMSYSFRPTQAEGAVFLVQRMIYSALRPDELVEGGADLPGIVRRLIGENGALPKDSDLSVTEWEGIRRLDTAWLVPSQTDVIQTRTVLLDMGDVVYFIQAQYDPASNAALQPTIEAILDSMAYVAPARPLDSSQTGLEPGFLAPDFTLPGLGQDTITLSDYRGEVVLLNLWASWCGPCHMEAPHLQSMYSEYDGAFEIVAVNVGESVVEAEGFVNEYGLTFPVPVDSRQEVAALYELRAYPTTYVIGRDGVILDVIVGSFSEQGLRDVLALYVGR